MSEWQPMETAPRDGSMFLCWVSAERYGEDDCGNQRSVDVSEHDFARWNSDADHPDGGYFMNMMGQIGDAQDVTHWVRLTTPYT